MQEASTELIGVLEQTRPRLLALTEERASEKPFADKWSLKEILGHLVDSAANNHQRFVRMQERPDIGSFSYEQEHWVASQQYQRRSWPELVELWYHFNRHLAHVIAKIDPASLSHTCDMDYPAPATLRFVVEDYIRHVRHHLGQILEDTDPRWRRKWTRRNPQEPGAA